jgi:hypothetical protein
MKEKEEDIKEEVEAEEVIHIKTEIITSNKTLKRKIKKKRIEFNRKMDIRH